MSAQLSQEHAFDDYLRQNRAVYDALAPDYARRVASDVLNDLPLVFRIWSHVRAKTSDGISVLDVGCGHGVNLAMFERLGANTTGVDFSPHMLSVARRTSPSSRLVEAEFLSATLPVASYNLVFAKAFVHLFPISACGRVFEKFHDLLASHGLLYIATTWSERSYEGYQRKTDYTGNLQRFRRVWAAPDLASFCESQGFTIVDQWRNDEHKRTKRWVNFLLEATCERR